MSFNKLPRQVQQAATLQLKGAQIIAAGSEVENGKTIYEVETRLAGKTRDLSFDRTRHTN